MTMTTSLDLLHKVKSMSDAQAWGAFLLKYEPFIESCLTRYGLDGHAAADVRQDVMCVLLRELPRFEHSGNAGAFRTWLRKITANRLATFLRRQTRLRGPQVIHLESAVEQLVRDDSELAQRWDREHDCFLIGRLLERIAPDFAPQTIAAFEKQVFGELSADEVAELLCMPKASVITAKSRVLRRLKQHATELEERI
ncbi:RNA polymerase sigma factor [Aureliella helgolandensis]|uniref:RNA polymerase sigma factor RpoE n=1 Tax=Aureliella helgolandensis TaxID=2527968 RepID=A0A518G3K3_9BACT|nr:sigma-70 family RNA polymerase sigma factor [Aureliella helgolandensis]QDV23173.1 RNA polymerase sigma factor RpoE [Aureliella helgolandensis]